MSILKVGLFGVKNETGPGNHAIHGMPISSVVLPCIHGHGIWSAMHCDTTIEPSPTIKRRLILPIAQSSELYQWAIPGVK